MSARYVTLPSGKRVGLRSYALSWRILLTMKPLELVNGFSHFAQPAGEVLSELRAGMVDRINRHDPAFGRGRKWDPSWQAETWRTAREVNTPRLVVRWIPDHLRARLQHRLYKEEE